MKLNEKANIVENLYERLSKAQIVILTDYKGLNAETLNSLRKKLRETNTEYQVVKNTLLKRASEKAGFNVDDNFFKGSTAVALGFNEPTISAKVLSSFITENQKLEIKFGIMKGKVLDFASIKALSELPSRDVILGQLLSTLNGVSTSLVRVLNNLPVKLLNVLNAIKDKKETA